MSNILYSDIFLLDRFNEIKKDKKKATFFSPTIKREPKIRKTFIIDFNKFCSAIKREKNEIKLFIENETQYKTSCSGNDLIIDNANSNIEKQIRDILTKYIKTKVLCQESKCSSGNTEIIKENRIIYMICNTCKCKKALE